MNAYVAKALPTVVALELFQPGPDVQYDLEATARLAGTTRRTILRYCRAGLLRPVFHPPYGVMSFTNESVLAAQRLEHLRASHGLDLAGLRTVAGLFDEVERLRAELRFWRGR